MGDFDDDVKILEKVNNKIVSVLNNSLISSMGLADRQIDDIIFDVSDKCFKDIDKLVKSDQGIKPDGGDFVSSFEYVINSYSCVEAVIHYRVANYIYYYNEIDNLTRTRISRKICEEIKNRYQIDIHPEARIGVPFILDHGFGTVIGQTAEIGNNCYFLNCVTLGAAGIGQNPHGKRHPTIKDNVKIGIDEVDDGQKSTIKDHATVGDDVEIGAHVGIYGPVVIGNDVRINPHCMIGIDVPDHHTVTVSTQVQMCHLHTKEKKAIYNVSIYGVIPVKNDHILIFGENLDFSSSYLVDEHYNIFTTCTVSIQEMDRNKILLKLTLVKNFNKSDAEKLKENAKLVLRDDDYDIIIGKSQGLRAVYVLA